MKKVFNNAYPVSYLSKNTLLIFKGGVFKFLDIYTNKDRNLSKIKLSKVEKLFFLIPIIARVLRFGIRCSIHLNRSTLLYVIRNTIYELNIIDGSISKGFSTNNNSRPLAFSQILGITGFEDGIYFGEYKSNSLKKPIAIYRRLSTDHWIKVFQFSDGTIEHIHHIVADKYNDTVFIFTGDFDNSAGIWIAKDNFSFVEPVLIGDQNYRGCVAFPTSNGIIYATDSPFANNSIRILTKNFENEWISKKVLSINGPSIYGCEWNGELVFSTSVEGDGRNQSIFYKFFGRKRGIGVKSSYSYVYKGNLEDGFRVIYKVKKDILPFFLFQFGTLNFPSGINISKFLPIYHIATKRHSLGTLFLSD